MATKQRVTKKDQKAGAVQRSSAAAPAPARSPRSYERERSRRARIRRRRHRFFMVFCVILVCVAAVLATTIFFRVSNVSVQSETRYDAEELITASGIRSGDNMAFLQTRRIAQQLEEMYPYLQDVKVHRQLPSTVTITFSERTPILSVQNGEKYLLVDETGRVLQEKNKTKKNTIEILGVDASGLSVGGFVTDDSSKQLNEIMQLVQLLQQNDLQKDIYIINRESAKDIRMMYQDRYTILMGNLKNLEHKIQFLQAILKEPTLPHNGVIDLTNEKEARYRPEEVDITQDQAEFETPEEQAQRIAQEESANDAAAANNTADNTDNTAASSDSTSDSSTSDNTSDTSDSAASDASGNSSDTSNDAQASENASGQDSESSSKQ